VRRIRSFSDCFGAGIGDAQDEEFYRVAAKNRRSNCVSDVSKLFATGVELRPVEEALFEAWKNWKPAGP
jgi:hypothetical protein